MKTTFILSKVENHNPYLFGQDFRAPDEVWMLEDGASNRLAYFKTKKAAIRHINRILDLLTD